MLRCAILCDQWSWADLRAEKSLLIICVYIMFLASNALQSDSVKCALRRAITATHHHQPRRRSTSQRVAKTERRSWSRHSMVKCNKKKHVKCKYKKYKIAMNKNKNRNQQQQLCNNSICDCAQLRAASFSSNTKRSETELNNRSFDDLQQHTWAAQQKKRTVATPSMLSTRHSTFNIRHSTLIAPFEPSSQLALNVIKLQQQALLIFGLILWKMKKKHQVDVATLDACK